MVRVSLFYPNESGKKFDLQYYTRHTALVGAHLSARLTSAIGVHLRSAGGATT